MTGLNIGLPDTNLLIDRYKKWLMERVSKVRIFGEQQERELSKIFIELSIVTEYQRPGERFGYRELLDEESRRYRNPFDNQDDRKDEQKAEKSKQTIKPDDLLKESTSAMIVGAPGGGKSVLMRYLAMRTLSTKRFPIFIELKSITEDSFKGSKGKLADLIFECGIAEPLALGQERGSFKIHFFNLLSRGEVSIFLDGLDEIKGTSFFHTLCESVSNFQHSAYKQNNLIISTRPYALERKFDGIREMEISALNE